MKKCRPGALLEIGSGIAVFSKFWQNFKINFLQNTSG